MKRLLNRLNNNRIFASIVCTLLVVVVSIILMSMCYFVNVLAVKNETNYNTDLSTLSSSWPNTLAQYKYLPNANVVFGDNDVTITFDVNAKVIGLTLLVGTSKNNSLTNTTRYNLDMGINEINYKLTSEQKQLNLFNSNTWDGGTIGVSFELNGKLLTVANVTNEYEIKGISLTISNENDTDNLDDPNKPKDEQKDGENNKNNNFYYVKYVVGALGGILIIAVLFVIILKSKKVR